MHGHRELLVLNDNSGLAAQASAEPACGSSHDRLALERSGMHVTKTSTFDAESMQRGDDVQSCLRQEAADVTVRAAGDHSHPSGGQSGEFLKICQGSRIGKGKLRPGARGARVPS
jgi:hypothetical protein